MKTLLALSIALLSLNLYGDDKPALKITGEDIIRLLEIDKLSVHGLEGWGEEGVHIFVGCSKADKTCDLKAIKNQVELKLRLAGIKIRDKKTYKDYLVLRMQAILIDDVLVGYSMTMHAKRPMTFMRNGKEYNAGGSSNNYYGGLTPPNYRQSLDTVLDQLLLDYLKANPKPKEKKSLIEP